MSDIPEGYKQTEVGVIPQEWDVIPLIRISSMSGRIGWQGLKQSEFTMNPDDPFLITGMNFKDGEITWEEVYHIPHNRYDEAKEIQLKIDDVLMTKDGTIGKLLYINQIPYPGKASLNSHLLVFRPLNNKYISKFLFYQLDSKIFKNHIELEKSGTTFFGITQEAVGKYKAYLPTLPEQQAIASALSDVDALITALEQLITKKRNIKQGAMQQLLTGKKRLPGFSGEWEVKKLGELGSFSKGKGIRKDEVISEGLPCIRYGEIYTTHNDYIKSFKSFITQSLANESIEIKKGDLLFAGSGETAEEIGKCVAFVGNERVFAGGDIVILRPSINNSSLFLGYLLNNPIVSRQKARMGQGDAVVHISGKNLSEIQIPLPPTKAEQTAIVTIITDIDSEIEALEKKLEKYKMIKQGVMQNLLTGKIRLV